MPCGERKGVSVVLATFNGERFLDEQLKSLSEQSLLPLELVVSDDGSSDGTVALIDEFTSGAPFPVRLVAQSSTQGVTANFARALERAEGSLIATCDQDDIWEPTKLERLAECIGNGTVAAASDAHLIDDDGASLHETFWGRSGFDAAARARFVEDPRQALLRENPISGATALFSAEVVRSAQPIPRTGIHDWWLLLAAASIGQIQLVEEPLVRYRQHAANAIGVPARGPRSATRQLRSRSRPALWSEEEMFIAFGSHPLASSWGRGLEEKIDLMRFRREPGSSLRDRFPPIVRNLVTGRYSQYARGVRSALADLIKPR